MERTIGEIITLPNGKKVEITEAIGCYGCIYENESVRICAEIAHALGSSCSDMFRTDGKNIIYKEIKKD